MQDHFPAGLAEPLTFCRGGSSGQWNLQFVIEEAICKLLPLPGTFAM